VTGRSGSANYEMKLGSFRNFCNTNCKYRDQSAAPKHDLMDKECSTPMKPQGRSLSNSVELESDPVWEHSCKED